jgi:predicted O-linked N-acetylglucosamine transferase (SPINDLY family)
MTPSERARAYCSQGTALIETREFDAALASLDEAIALEPGLADAHCNRGVVLAEMKRFDAALKSLDQAIALDPDFAEAHANRGAVLQELGRWAEAAAGYERAIALAPERGFLLGHIAHARMQLCDWNGLEACAARLTQRLQRGEPACAPFPALALTGSPSLQRRAAELWVRMKFPPDASLGAIGGRARGQKIRIGYFSADFRNHAVSFLTADLFETHDRSSFEVWGFSFGLNTQDAMRRRLELSFDRFIDVRQQSDRSIALLARSMQLDIAVDLGGFTKDSRPGIFALRAAPLQVSYLGFLGTMGAPYMDYLIADAAIVPPGDRVNYAEQILYVPTYQVNDAKRRIADRSFTREELGLPASGFVFCCFNASYKIIRATFAGWMRILLRAPGSVLLLLAANDTVKSNLRREAVLSRVDPDRLVFGDRLPMPEYLARYRAADLFLDTLPYNAGTTASDALWAGLPVLTCAGEAFAGRVAASLLTGIGMPELIASTQEQYENLAVALAAQPERLARIKQRLGDARHTAPLFNTPLFTRTLEAAYVAIYDRYQAGLPPQHVAAEARSER